LDDEEYRMQYKCELRDAVMRAKERPCSLFSGYLVEALREATGGPHFSHGTTGGGASCAPHRRPSRTTEASPRPDRADKRLLLLVLAQATTAAEEK
jgi:hypothetical protein